MRSADSVTLSGETQECLNRVEQEQGEPGGNRKDRDWPLSARS